MRIVSFIFLFSLAFSGPALAEIQNFKHFSIDIPESWNYSEAGEMVTVTAKDNSSIVVFSPDKLPQGQTSAEFAAFFSNSYQGSPPVFDNAGTFQFDYTNDVGAKAHVLISQADSGRDSVFLIVIVGEQHPDLPRILKSVTMAGE